MEVSLQQRGRCQRPGWAGGEQVFGVDLLGGMLGAVQAAGQPGGLFDEWKATASAVVSKGRRPRALRRLRLGSPVWMMTAGSSGGNAARRVLVELSHGVGHALVVAFGGREIIGPAFLDDDARRLGLAVWGDGGGEGTLYRGRRRSSWTAGISLESAATGSLPNQRPLLTE